MRRQAPLPRFSSRSGGAKVSRLRERGLANTAIAVMSDTVFECFQLALVWVDSGCEQGSKLVGEVLSIAFEFAGLELDEELLTRVGYTLFGCSFISASHILFKVR